MKRLLRSRALITVLVIYGTLSVSLWPVPVFNLLHVESSAVVALVAFFGAGLLALRLFDQGEPFWRVVAAQEGALLVPWGGLTVTMLWAPNCGYLEGLTFYLLFPVVTVVLAVSLAYAVQPLRRRGLLLVGIGGAVVLLGPLYDLGLHPQFYTYNHVFGGVLGPIYDEELAVRPGLFAFRGVTLLWALLCYLIGRRIRWRRSGSRPVNAWVEDGRGGVLVAMLIGLSYAFAAPLGFNSPAWYIQQELGSVYRTPHFDLYYASSALPEEAVQRLGEDHEFHYARLADRLDVEVPQRIASYLYPDAETKARLTGARYTNVAPVWLRQPQTHVLLGSYEEVFPHELVHVFSRTFGLPVLNASLSVGLVEGVAVALEPPDGRPTPHEQVAVAALQRIDLGYSTGSISLAPDLAARLSPLGFWTGRGAVSYTTMGSFVRYLIDMYGPSRFKRAYAEADFEAAYGRPLAVLAAEWEQAVFDQPVVARAAAALVARRFTIPSLFEKRCPHYVPRYRRRYRAATEALAVGDTTAALAALEASLALQPGYPAALAVWAQVHLARGRSTAVIDRLDTLAAARQTASLAVPLGDAWTLIGRPDSAQAAYEVAAAALPLYAHEERALVGMRRDLITAPAIVSILVSGMDPAEQARQLAAIERPAPAVPIMRALRLAAAGAYEPAFAALRTTAVPVEPEHRARAEALARQRLVWIAHLAYRVDDLATAQQQADAAAAAYANVGDVNTAAALSVWADQMRWTEQWRTVVRLSGTSGF